MKKTTLLAVGAFAALLVLVLVTREDKVNEGVPKLTLPALGEVTAIEVSGANQAKLTREGEGWKVSGFEADENQVKPLLDALKDFRANDFITEKAEKQAELEVDEAKGTKVQLTTTTGPGWSLVFGKAAKSGGTYVREAKSNAVFTTNSPASYMVKKNVSGWRKKTIATAPVADFVKVTVTQPEGAVTLVNAEGTWKLDPEPKAPYRFDPQAAQRLVQQLSTLNAQDFAESFGEQAATIDVELKDGKKLAMKLGKKTEAGTVPLQVEGNPQVYLLPQWTADQLTKKVDDFRDLSLLAFEPDKVNRISINAGGKATVLAKDAAAGWKLVEPKSPPAGFELDAQSVNSQLMRLKGLRGMRVASGVNDGQAGLGKPVATVELGVEGGPKQQLRLGGETPQKELYAKGTADGLTYVVGAHEKQQLEQGVELFKKRPPPDMSQIRGLEQLPPDVRRQLEAQLRQRNN